MEFDAIVIGGGVVGCTTALRLREMLPRGRIAILEKNGELCSEASRWNSGVIHSGIHQKAGFLKSDLAREGAKKIVAFCEKEGVPCVKRGMLIVAAEQDLFRLFGECSSLARLWRNSSRQGIDIRFVSKRALRAMEPNIRAAFGIHIPDIWVIDQRAFAQKLSEKLRDARVEVFLRCQVSWLSCLNPQYCRVVIGEGKERFFAPIVVNAAGVYADQISRAPGIPRYRIYPCRGEYYEVVTRKRHLVAHSLIYPALPPGHPVKGIHLTKTWDGRLLIGPNAKPWDARSDDFSVRTPPDEFLKAAQRFLPDLAAEDLRWLGAGIRAKVNKGEGEDDFVISLDSKRPALVNLVGIESPGLTASFAIADHVAKLLAPHAA